jgi:hypothetical protein
MKRVPNTEKCLHVTVGIRVPFLSKPSSFETSSRLCIVRENFGGLGSCSTVYCGQQTHRSHMRHLNLGRLALLLSLCSATACNHEDQLRNHLFQSTVGTHKVSKHCIDVPPWLILEYVLLHSICKIMKPFSKIPAARMNRTWR